MVGGAACLLAASAGSLMADRENTYLTIITNRNAFDLREPPPPAPPPAKIEPPKPTASVRLSGITTMFSKARALFEIIEAPGKPAEKPILLVGEKHGDVELLAIDVDKKQVTVRLAGTQTNLVLEARKAGAGPAPKLPGGVRPGFPIPGMKLPSPSQRTTAGVPSPTVITPGSSGTSSGRGGVVVAGGSGAASTAAPATPSRPAISTPIAGSRTPYRLPIGNVSSGLTVPGAVTPGSTATSDRSIPTPLRQTRTQSSGPATRVDPDTYAAQQYLMMIGSEQDALSKGEDHPPSPPIPGLTE